MRLVIAWLHVKVPDVDCVLFGLALLCSGKHHSPGLGGSGKPRGPGMRSASRGYSGDSLIRKSQANSAGSNA